jgi:hypothetical protein
VAQEIPLQNLQRACHWAKMQTFPGAQGHLRLQIGQQCSLKERPGSLVDIGQRSGVFRRETLDS